MAQVSILSTKLFPARLTAPATHGNLPMRNRVNWNSFANASRGA